jgi:ubiquinone/menaquinone biosynthesis C-methylase UbiE
MGEDLLHSSEIKQLVREAYRGAPGNPAETVCQLYDPAELARVPRAAAEHSFGVANHMRHAEIAPGQVVLDLGCGAGIDTILAAQRTGPSGRVYALDFLPEMLERTVANAKEAGVEEIVVPVEGEIEAIPLPDDSVDHIISNGVINLSPRKGRVFRECARVLRPGGAFCASDLTIVEEDLPPAVLTHPAAWAG